MCCNPSDHLFLMYSLTRKESVQNPEECFGCSRYTLISKVQMDDYFHTTSTTISCVNKHDFWVWFCDFWVWFCRVHTQCILNEQGCDVAQSQELQHKQKDSGSVSTIQETQRGWGLISLAGPGVLLSARKLLCSTVIDFQMLSMHSNLDIWLLSSLSLPNI